MNKPLHLPTLLKMSLLLALLGAPLNAQPLATEKQSLDWLGFQQFQEVSRVFLRTTDKAKYKLDTSRPKTIIVVLENTYIALKNTGRELPTQFFKSPIRKITTRSIEGPSPTTFVEIHLKRPATFQRIQKDNTLALDFAR